MSKLLNLLKLSLLYLPFAICAANLPKANLETTISSIAQEMAKIKTLKIHFFVQYSRFREKREEAPKKYEYIWYLSGKKMRLDRVDEVTKRHETLGIFDGEKYIISYYFQDLPAQARKQMAKTYQRGDITQVHINSFNMPTSDEGLGRMDFPLAYFGLGLDLGLAQGSKLLNEIMPDYKVKLVGTEKIDEHLCYVLEMRKEEIIEGGNTTYLDWKRLWVDPAIGYRIRHREDYYRENLPRFWLSCDDFKEYQGGIWLPHKVKLQYLRFDKEANKSEPFLTEILAVKEIVVNESIPDSFFSIQAPIGTPIWDMRTNRVYKAGEELPTDEDVLKVAKTAKGFLDGTVSIKDIEEKTSKGQIESYFCGPNALLAVCGILGIKTSSKEIAQLAGTDEKGFTSLAGLKRAAEALGLKAEGVDITLDELRKSKKLAIAFIPPDHFIVVVGFSADKVV
ncbi:MAG: cysteine peptidase family C39 domain-containing protein, partial [bacterium]